MAWKKTYCYIILALNNQWPNKIQTSKKSSRITNTYTPMHGQNTESTLTDDEHIIYPYADQSV